MFIEFVVNNYIVDFDVGFGRLDNLVFLLKKSKRF